MSRTLPDMGAPSSIGSPPPAQCEIHFLSGGRRGGVYRLHLGRARLTALSAAVLLYLFLLAFAAGMAPGVVAALLGGAEYRSLAAERLSQGARLHALDARLEELRRRGDDLLAAVRKAALVYGLPPAAMRPPPSPPPAEMPAALPGAIYGGTFGQGERLRRRIQEQLAAVDTALAAVRAFEQAHPEAARETPAVCPLRGATYVLSNPFGRQRNAFTRSLAMHGGIDLAAPAGTPIRAPADGVVVFAGTYPLGRSATWWRYGSLVAVAHGDRFLTLYGHCGEIRTVVGRQVRRGDELATVGSSGWSLNPHLHYEVRRRAADGELVPVDPLLYILDRRWPGEERLLAQAPGAAQRGAPAGEYEPLPPELGGSRSRSPARPPRRS